MASTVSLFHELFVHDVLTKTQLAMIRPSSVPASTGVVLSTTDCPMSPADIEEMKRLPFSEVPFVGGFDVVCGGDVAAGYFVCSVSTVLCASEPYLGGLLLNRCSGEESRDDLVYSLCGSTFC